MSGAASSGLSAPSRAPPPEGRPRPSSSSSSSSRGRGRCAYVYSQDLTALAFRAPVNQDRSHLVHSLIAACGLLESSDVQVTRPSETDNDTLQGFHSREYIQALCDWESLDENTLGHFGLEYDCPAFPGLMKYCRLVAGASLAGAEALLRGARVAMAWDGGRHHAKPSRASGYCYVNDIVIAIRKLRTVHPRVMALKWMAHWLNLQLDVHHGDAVQDAFYTSKQVLCISLHHFSRGFFPGTGCSNETGAGSGCGFNLNLPLKDGLRDSVFVEAFRELAGGAMGLFKPPCVVIQCGADGLAGDPVGQVFSLSPEAHAACIREALCWGSCLLLLGGGGYCSASAARCWALATAAATSQDLNDDVPDHPHLMSYSPNFSLRTLPKPPLRPDQNTVQGVREQCQRLLGSLRAGLQATGVSDAGDP